MKDTIRQLIQQALTQLVTDGVLPEGLTPAIQVENARDKTHGDFASNIAMMPVSYTHLTLPTSLRV